MKKKVYIGFISAMVVTGLLCASSLAGFALTATKAASEDPTVTLAKTSDTAIGFTFNRDDTDLFDNFKGLVPGDVVTQKIIVKDNIKETAGGSTYNVYLYAENAGVEKLDGTTAPTDLFEKVDISVQENGKVKDLKKTGADSKGTFLGNFKFNDTAELTVKLALPKELGNEYQNCKGKVNWYFYAEQVAEETIGDDDTPLNPPPFETIKDDEIPLQSLPKTGDDSNIMFFEICAAASVAVLAGLNTVRVLAKRKSREEK